MTAPQRAERPKTLDELAYDLEVAKAGAAMAKDQVEAAEQALLAAVPCELEGSTTTFGSFYRITATGKLTRSIDAEKLAQVRAVVPAAIFDRVVSFEPKLSLRDYRYVELNEPQFFKAFAECVTAKPGKPALKIERLTEE